MMRFRRRGRGRGRRRMGRRGFSRRRKSLRIVRGRRSRIGYRM